MKRILIQVRVDEDLNNLIIEAQKKMSSCYFNPNRSELISQAVRLYCEEIMRMPLVKINMMGGSNGKHK